MTRRIQYPARDHILFACSFALLALTSSCGPSLQSESSDLEVILGVEPGTATAGDTVTLVLVNGSEDSIGYNLCASGLERQLADDWQVVPVDRICTLELRILEPGARTSYPIDLPDTLTAGQYRYSTSIDYLESGGRAGVSSEPFTVES